jgi:Protein of unknown function (DUF4011)
VAETGNRLSSQLEKARRELLDFSRRNRLLSMPRGQGRLLEIADALSDEVFRLLVREGKPIAFLPASGASEDSEPAEGEQEFHDLPLAEETEVDDRGTALRRGDQLQTRLTAQGLEKRLLRLYYDAQSTFDEQGVNILYIALGSLEWYESRDSSLPSYAPLLLVPVRLERASARGKFRISWKEEEITSNLSVIEKFRGEFAISIPEVPELEDIVPSAYFAEVADAVESQPRFKVHPNEMVLGFFSFAKFLMYRDLDPRNWPEGSSLADHQLIQALLSDGFRIDSPLIQESDLMDEGASPAETVHIRDADSSQAAAIEAVKKGHNLVISGTARKRKVSDDRECYGDSRCGGEGSSLCGGEAGRPRRRETPAR